MKPVVVGGKLSDKPFYKILRELISNKSTGTLIIQSSQDTIVLTFEFGLCVHVESHYPNPAFQVGQLMLLRRWITATQLDELLNEQKTQLKKLGYLARTAELITAIQLMEVLEDQALILLYPCFTWTQGLYHFRSEDSVFYDRSSSRPIDLSAFTQIGEKILKNSGWLENRFKNWDIVPILKPGVEVVPPGVQTESKRDTLHQAPFVLSVEQEKVYSQINNISTIRQLLAACHQFPYFTLMALADLEDAGVIEIQSEEQEKKRWQIQKEAIGSFLKANYRFTMYPAFALFVILIFIFLPSRVMITSRESMTNKEKSIMTKQKMDQLMFALNVYYFKSSSFPEFLSILESDGYLEDKLLLDMWGNSFYYKKQRNGYVLISSGPDKAWATDDDIQIVEDGENIDSASFFPNWSESRTKTTLDRM